MQAISPASTAPEPAAYGRDTAHKRSTSPIISSITNPR